MQLRDVLFELCIDYKASDQCSSSNLTDQRARTESMPCQCGLVLERTADDRDAVTLTAATADVLNLLQIPLSAA